MHVLYFLLKKLMEPPFSEYSYLVTHLFLLLDSKTELRLVTHLFLNFFAKKFIIFK
jgi:hypothetical protein